MMDQSSMETLHFSIYRDNGFDVLTIDDLPSLKYKKLKIYIKTWDLHTEIKELI